MRKQLSHAWTDCKFKVMHALTLPASAVYVPQGYGHYLKWLTCFVYLDDVVVFSTTFNEHLRILETVLEAIKSSGLTLTMEKCRSA